MKKKKEEAAMDEIGDSKFIEKLTDYLTCGSTIQEITEKFKISENEARAGLERVPEGFRLVRQEAAEGEVLILLPAITEIRPKERIWQFQTSSEKQPYLTVLFPDSLNLKKINVVPIADIWYGDRLHDEKRFDEYVGWISQRPDVFTFFNGDIFKKFSSSKSEQSLLIEKTLQLRNKLLPIAHKILWAQAGDNEESNSLKHGFDPLRFICDEFGIPYFTEPVYVDIFWKARKKEPFTLFCIHGRSNAQTRGGQINALVNSRSFQEFVMFTVMGHIKSKRLNFVRRICRNLQEFQLESRTEYIIICPSFVKYFGSEAAKKGYRPYSWGAVSCRLYADGRYWTSS